MKRYIIKIIGALFGLILACCSIDCNKKSEVYLQLERVDSLFYNDCDSAAALLFSTIPQPEDSSECLAYYNLQKARMYVRNNNVLPPDILNFTIDYYTSVADTVKMVFAYDYKCNLLLRYSGDRIEAEKCNRMAENLVANIDYDLLKYNVFANGYRVASYYYDTDKCISYALKALEIGEKLNDKARIAYPSRFLSICYLEKDSLDKAQLYVNKCLNLIDSFDDNDKACVYNSFGEVLERKGDTLLAERNYLIAIEQGHFYLSYANMARLYIQRGMLDEAEKYYQKAVVPLGYDSNIPIMRLYADALFSRGNYKKAADIYNEMLAQKDSLLKSTEDNLNVYIRNMEKHLSEQEAATAGQEMVAEKYKIISFCLLVVMAIQWIIFIGVMIYNKRKHRRSENNLTDDQMIKGEEMLRKVVNGECISQWDNTERKLLASYYCTTNNLFSDSLSENYGLIPTNYIIYWILIDLGKNKQEMAYIMGLSDSAFRTLKSRAERYRDLKKF